MKRKKKKLRVSADIKKLEFCVSKNKFQCIDVVCCARFLNVNYIDTAEKNILCFVLRSIEKFPHTLKN